MPPMLINFHLSLNMINVVVREPIKIFNGFK